MESYQTIFVILFAIGIGFLIYTLFGDPGYILKGILRILKNHINPFVFLVSSIIWGPIWIIDKIFDLKIFISVFDDASIAKPISFTDFDKYISIDKNDTDRIIKIVKKEKCNTAVTISPFGKSTILKIDNKIPFHAFNSMVLALSHISTDGLVSHAKGILINRLTKDESYFIFYDSAIPLKLIGKTGENKKIYVDLNFKSKPEEKIYFNSNMDNFKKMNFEEFEENIRQLVFERI
jgi:hypothetical protein